MIFIACVEFFLSSKTVSKVFVHFLKDGKKIPMEEQHF